MSVIIPDPEICRKCMKAQKQARRWLKKVNTGDVELDTKIREDLVGMIKYVIHEYYGLKPEFPEEKEYIR